MYDTADEPLIPEALHLSVPPIEPAGAPSDTPPYPPQLQPLLGLTLFRMFEMRADDGDPQYYNVGLYPLRHRTSSAERSIFPERHLRASPSPALVSSPCYAHTLVQYFGDTRVGVATASRLRFPDSGLHFAGGVIEVDLLIGFRMHLLVPSLWWLAQLGSITSMR